MPRGGVPSKGCAAGSLQRPNRHVGLAQQLDSLDAKEAMLDNDPETFFTMATLVKAERPAPARKRARK